MKNIICNLILKPFLIIGLLLLITSDTFAQCPMCRMGLESNLKNGGSAGLGFNLGILYLLLTPYLIVGGIAYVWWRNKRKIQENNLIEEF